MLLYLVKHSHPNLANMTRKLSKANHGANPATYKELQCVIKYVIDMKNLEIKMEPTRNTHEPREIVCFSNSAMQETQWVDKALVASYFIY